MDFRILPNRIPMKKVVKYGMASLVLVFIEYRAGMNSAIEKYCKSLPIIVEISQSLMFYPSVLAPVRIYLTSSASFSSTITSNLSLGYSSVVPDGINACLFRTTAPITNAEP